MTLQDLPFRQEVWNLSRNFNFDFWLHRLKGRQEKKVSKEEKEGRHRGRGQDKGGEKEKREKEEKRRGNRKYKRH